jgi:NADPH:quinone reductase-like Zn-dependent oxidoreductase
MMKAVVIREFGGPEVLSYEDIAIPQPKPGHVLVKVSAAGVNYYDTLIRSGAVSTEIALPHIGGSDIVGEVHALGDGVKRWQQGDKVIVAPGYPTEPAEREQTPENQAPSYYPTGTFEWGGYAQYMQVHQRWLLRDDTELPAEELATLPLVLVTAVHAVKTLGQVGPGSRVLVQAGASGSGSMVIQVAKALGAKVITTVSTEPKAAVARNMGADEIVFYKQSDVLAAVKEWTHGDGVDVVIDPVGGVAFGDNVRSLKPRGTIVNFGLSGGIEGTIPHLYQFFRNELRILGSWMGSMDELRFGLDLVKQGLIKPAIDKVLPLSSAREVHRMVEDHAIAGKVSLLPWE